MESNKETKYRLAFLAIGTVVSAVSLSDCTALGSEVVYTEPVLFEVSPDRVPFEALGVELTLRGENFTPQSVGHWSGLPRPTTYVSAQQLKVSLTRLDLGLDVGPVQVDVATPAEDGTVHLTNQREVTIALDMPVLESITPNSIEGVAGEFVNITAIGSGFSSRSRLMVCDACGTRPRSFEPSGVTPNTLTTTIEAGRLRPGVATTWIENVRPQGSALASGHVTLSIVNPLTRIDSVQWTGNVGQQATFDVFGWGLKEGSVVRWVGQDLPTAYLTTPRRLLRADVEAMVPDSLRNAYLTVFTPPPGGGESARYPIDIDWGTPEVQSTQPRRVPAGYPSQVVFRVYGNYFTPNSVGLWNDEPRETEFQSGSEVWVTVTEQDRATPGVSTMRVMDRVIPDTSGTFDIEVYRAIPTVERTRPDSVQAGYPSRTVFRVYGSNYTPNSVGLWNDQPRSTEYRSQGELWIEVTTADKAVPGTGYMRVYDPIFGDTSTAYPIRLYP